MKKDEELFKNLIFVMALTK